MDSLRGRRFFSSLASFGCVLLALLLFAPAGLRAQAVTVSLDDPNQMTLAPTVGTLTLDFTGVVTLSIGLVLAIPSLDNPVNDMNTFALAATLDPAFAAFLSTVSGTYTGTLFTVDVPAGTPVDLYNLAALGGFSELSIEVATAGGSFESASASFSVEVIPEPSTLWLVVFGCLGCCLIRRALVVRKSVR